MGRLPQLSDFPSNVKLSITPPPKSDAPTNILVLLHGLGDKHDSFTKLGSQLNLPETACISVQGPANLLDLDGFHWGDDIIFDSGNGGLDADAGFKLSTALLKGLIEDDLMETCGYKAGEIVVFGFGQGGMLALMTALAIHNLPKSPSQTELGGVISIGAGLPAEAPAALVNKCKTPVLVCAGAGESAVTDTSEDKLKRLFEHVEIRRYRRPGDSMPRDRDEMMPVMQFFSRRLKSVKGVPEGAVEIS
ncbi:putative hydrolase [Teratosphaeria destructans]|uniref:Hydrolase n=1 Tax=Teratosphaeria destructans TaxID=418781 RepID=A0A9W7VZX2_9PEZI|nr:putative hydrolase [Teratosphaeria destructans]